LNSKDLGKSSTTALGSRFCKRDRESYIERAMFPWSKKGAEKQSDLRQIEAILRVLYPRRAHLVAVAERELDGEGAQPEEHVLADGAEVLLHTASDVGPRLHSGVQLLSVISLLFNSVSVRRRFWTEPDRKPSFLD
jgi:hypothetical protein